MNRATDLPRRAALFISEYKPTGKDPMFIYPIYKNLVDVFQGEGWEVWSRVAITRFGARVVAGVPLNVEQLKEVAKKCKK